MSSKRRKIDAQETPTSAVSAVSALAARRRLVAGGAVPQRAASPEEEETTPPKQTNPFSLLQTLNQNNSASSPKITPSKPPRGAQARSAQKSFAKEKGSSLNVEQDDSEGVIYTKSSQYSSFRLTKRNYRVKSAVVAELRLEHSERFLVLGSFGLRIKSGEVTVAGATLRPSDAIHWIHAPLCHAVPIMRTTERSELELHTDKHSQALRKLEQLSPLFRRIWNDAPNAEERKAGAQLTFKILCTSKDAPKKGIVQELVSPPEWNRKLASLVKLAAQGGSFSTLVCGPKSAGKSTFSKLLTNRLITGDVQSSSKTGAPAMGVAVLDLDPGQPEYAPSGTLSLVHITEPNLGTSFTNVSLDGMARKVIRCHALASVSPAAAPEFYLECAIDLFNTYRNTLREFPLVINTPGWILGTGLDLLSEVIAQMTPAEVVYMSEDGPADTVDALRNATTNVFTALPSQESEFTSRTAAHLRAMQTMSYFHLRERQGGESDTKPRWNPSPLSTIPPWNIRYSGPKSGILGILSYDDQSPPELFAETINGMVLAAVEIEDAKAFRETLRENPRKKASADVMDLVEDGENSLEPLVSRTPEGLPFIPNAKDVALDPRHSRMIGLVLIRGISTATQSLQIITPIPHQKIEQIKSLGRQIVLVHGKFDAPNWAYTEDLYERSGQEDGTEKSGLEIMDEDTGEDDSDVEPERVDNARDVKAIPWVEVLKGNEKRPVGSRVWRVRRDLGRGAGD